MLLFVDSDDVRSFLLLSLSNSTEELVRLNESTLLIEIISLIINSKL